MTEREDHKRLADELEGQADEMEQRTDELGKEIGDVGEDWQRKRSDEGVPGAPPPTDEESGDEESEEGKDGKGSGDD